ncbi:MAG TPA: 16S rRNA (cytidine(1402)-2'-O)-methyltransferase [Candidatus Binataceae bacterium]|nr:16S rRNA (cytidine(1402)-2'-O)-methyltransferase [Candidatus Binataceae bacterium]
MSNPDPSQRPASSEGVLYVVATPIGNLRDLTLRALEVLAEVDAIACEDTRHTARLLAAHGLRKPLISNFEHNEQRRAQELVARLQRGERIALVSDAGTPGISDPGYRLVRAAQEAGIALRAIPGPCAAIAALAVAGLPTDRFVFEGFLPARAQARAQRLRELAHESRTLVFYESARRLGESLAAMASELGPERPAALVRELTKLYEEATRETLGQLAARFARDRARGEITVVVAGAEAQPAAAQPGVGVADLIAAGMEPRAASKVVARLSGRSSREIYQEAMRARAPSKP